MPSSEVVAMPPWTTSKFRFGKAIAALDKDNFATKYADIISAIVYWSVLAGTRPGYMVREDDHLSNWPMEDLANLLFLETSTDIAVNHVLPIFAFVGVDDRVEDRDVINHCGFLSANYSRTAVSTRSSVPIRSSLRPGPRQPGSRRR